MTSIYIQEVSFANRALGETLTGSASSDKMWGLAGNDRMEGRGGNDWLDGGEGIDRAVFEGRRADYKIS